MLDLAKQFPTISALARAAGMKRTTLIEAWKRGNVFEEWQVAKRKHAAART